MSGGRFDYGQYRIVDIHERIQSELDKQGTEKEGIRDRFGNLIPYYNEWEDERNYPIYSGEVQNIMKDAIKYLKIAYIYAQRIDWFLSGDDGEESLIRRLKEELTKEGLQNGD